jgi:twitching motility protein PilT
MMLLEALARGLRRPGVTEFAVMAGRPPSVKVGAAYEPVAEFIPSEADVLEMLATLGGLAHIDSLGPEPARWKTVENGLGTLLVKAARRHGIVQALFVLQPSSGSLPAVPVMPVNPPAPPKAPAESSAVVKPPPPPVKAAAQREVRGGVEAVPISFRGAALTFGAAPELEFEDNRAPHVAPTKSTVPRRESPLFDRLLAEARQKNASDLHVVATRPSLFRVAGELVPVGAPIDAGEAEEILLATIPARLRPTFDRDGSCDFAVAHPNHGRVRVNVSRQRTGLKA